MEEDLSGNSLPTAGTDGRKRNVSYFYEPKIGNYFYGQNHPMIPHRIRMTHSLVLHYGLHNSMELNVPVPATPEAIRKFHSDDYVNFLSSVSPESLLDDIPSVDLRRFNVGGDCPVFEGLFGFCQASAGGSLCCW